MKNEKLQCQKCHKAEFDESLYEYQGEILCTLCLAEKVSDGFVGWCNDKTYPNKDQQICSLEEQLKNAIVLPIGYGLGQIVYMIPTRTNALKKTCAYRIINFSKSEIGCRADLSLITKEKGVEALYCASFDMFGVCIFPNLGLAEEKRLDELKGGQQ